MDTVPISSPERWTHAPLSGDFDGTSVWGRGSCDDKTHHIAIFEAVSALLEAGFQPKRTLLLSFGFDEELMRAKNEGCKQLRAKIGILVNLE